MLAGSWTAATTCGSPRTLSLACTRTAGPIVRINAMLWMIDDYARLGAAYFCLGCDPGCILNGIC